MLVQRKGLDRRLVAPLMLEEELETSGPSPSGAYLNRYRVVDNGLLSSELEPGAHSANVFFTPASEGHASLMSWEVTFACRERRDFWEAVTQRVIAEAVANLASHVATPQLYSLRMRLPAPSSAAATEWVRFVFDKGGGLPLPPPVPRERGDPLMSSGRARLIIPPFLRESITSAEADRGIVRYTVDNPGVFTYQVHTHSGRVGFRELRDVNAGAPGCEMLWQVEVCGHAHEQLAHRPCTNAYVHAHPARAA